MQLFTFFILAVSIIFTTTVRESFAIQPPPAKIIDQTVSPACIVVQPSYLAGQTPGYGTGSKGAALQIKNTCTGNILITGIETSKHELQVKEPVSAIDARMVTFESDAAKYKDYVFASAPETCKSVAAHLEQEYSDALKTDKAERRLREEETAKGENDPLREWRYKQRPLSVLRNRTEVACGSVLIPVGASFTVAMPWNTYFKVVGRSDGIKQSFQVSLEGKMINPEDPVEAEKLAAKGDNLARHTLALHYFDTKEHPYEDSLKLLRAAAEDGYWPSMYQMGICFETGYGGVPTNLEEAYFWYSVASELVKGAPSDKRDALAKQLDQQQLESVKIRTTDWKATHPKTFLK